MVKLEEHLRIQKEKNEDQSLPDSWQSMPNGFITSSPQIITSWGSNVPQPSFNSLNSGPFGGVDAAQLLFHFDNMIFVAFASGARAVLTASNSSCIANQQCPALQIPTQPFLSSNATARSSWFSLSSPARSVSWEPAPGSVSNWGSSFVRPGDLIALTELQRADPYPALMCGTSCPLQCVPNATDCGSMALSSLQRFAYAMTFAGEETMALSPGNCSDDARFVRVQTFADNSQVRLLCVAAHDGGGSNTSSSSLQVLVVDATGLIIMQGEADQPISYFGAVFRCSACAPYFTPHMVSQPLLLMLFAAVKTLLTIVFAHYFSQGAGARLKRWSYELYAAGVSRLTMHSRWQRGHRSQLERDIVERSLLRTVDDEELIRTLKLAVGSAHSSPSTTRNTFRKRANASRRSPVMKGAGRWRSRWRGLG